MVKKIHMKLFKLKRLLSFYIDFAICILICCEIINIIIKMLKIELNDITFYFISIVLILVITLFSRKDLLFKNQSLGKKIFGLAIYNEDDTIPTKSVLIQRSLTSIFLAPVDIFLILIQGKCTTDHIYKTKVVKVRK